MGFWRKLLGNLEQAPASVAQTPQQLFVEQCLALAARHPRVKRATARAGDDLAVQLLLDDGSEQTLFLANSFWETREASPQDKQARLGVLLGLLDEAGGEPSWEDAAPRLLPVLRTSGFASSAATHKRPVSRPFAPCLRLFLGVDAETSTSFVTRNQLDEWQQDLDTALSLAFDTLARHVAAGTDYEPYDASAAYPIWHVTRDDAYEASRLALPGYLASFRDKVTGTPIAVVPHNSLVVISGDGHAAAIERLARMAEAELDASPRPISSAIYTVNERDEVVPFRLAREHALHALVERGHYLLLASCYDQQKAVLDARFEASGTDVFVATFVLTQNQQTGALRSHATMGEGVPTLLPQTDRIALVPQSDEAKPFLLPWAQVLELAPECFEPAPEHDPPRLRTLAWPKEATLRELRTLAE
jgi:uncharacterized protein YtpQ (UPF0354 family)